MTPSPAGGLRVHAQRSAPKSQPRASPVPSARGAGAEVPLPGTPAGRIVVPLVTAPHPEALHMNRPSVLLALDGWSSSYEDAMTDAGFEPIAADREEALPRPS